MTDRKAGATIFIGCDQVFERRFLIGRAVADQSGMRGLACLRPHDEGKSFQRRCRRQHDPVKPQAIDHAADDRIAPISRGGDLRSQRQHQSHVDPVEGAQTKICFDLGAMLAQRRRAE